MRGLIVFGFLVLVLLTACGGPDATSAAVTAAGALPTGMSLGAKSSSAPRQLYPGVPAAQSVAYWSINPTGSITLFTYADMGARDAGFDAVAQSALAKPLDLGIGERAALSSPDDGCPECTEVVFARCGIVGHVRMFHVRPDQVMAYTRALDGAVSKQLCS